MTGVAESRRAWAWSVSAILPGLPQLARGRWAAGGGVLILWVSSLWVVMARWDRLTQAWRGGLDQQVALLALMSAICLCWGWSLRDLKRQNDHSSRSDSHWSLTLRRFGESRLAVFGLMVIVGIVMAAILSPLIAPFDPTHMPAFEPGGDAGLIRLPPSAQHPLGTDDLSRDILSRILFGARISLTVGFLAVLVAMSLGTVVGAVAGYLGGWTDSVLMRLVDVVISFPLIVLLLAIVAVFDRSLILIVLVLGLTLWPGTARIVRGEVLSLRERQFIQAARALGFSRARIIFRHLIPNALGPVIVAATLGIGNVILLEAGLSFLGMGVPAPTPTWGAMVADGQDVLGDAWWVATSPGLAIVLVVLSFNLVGDGLRDALDPKHR
jgi:peptide/nickel transport system permease protein